MSPQREFVQETDLNAVMQALADLDTPIWRYTDETIAAAREEGIELDDSRHCGPDAEAILESFGVGDGKVVIAADALGIMWMCLRGLLAHNQMLQKRMIQLEEHSASSLRATATKLDRHTGDIQTLIRNWDDLQLRVEKLESNEIDEDFAKLVEA